MGAGDVIVGPKRRANPNRYRFLANVKMREARHEGTSVKFIHAFFEQPDGNHPPVHIDPLFTFYC
jgi:hypothetical protein